jgi:uncharacterized caspase-like protein
MHKNYLSLVLSIPIVLLAPSLTCRAEQYLFLVGVQDHANPSNSPSLRYAEQDVHTLADLYTKAGVPNRNILLMTHRAADSDPNLIPRSDLIRANFEQFLWKLGSEDSIIVGLSGHGVQFKGDEFGYFSPIDSSLDPNRRDTLISLKEIYHKLCQSRAKTKLLLVDACRSYPKETSSQESLFPAHSADSLARKQCDGKAIAIFSCSPSAYSYESSKHKSGVLFYFVNRGLSGKADADRNGVINLAELESFAFNKVEK